MENLKKIKLFGNRDFSENFDMTLNFLKQNYVPILKGILILIPIYLVISYFMPNTSTISSGSLSSSLGIFTLNFLIAYILIILTSVLAMLYVLSYMSLYTKSTDGVVNNSDVWAKISKIFFPVLGGSILFGLIVSAGTILLIIPGIIVYVYLGFYCYVYINEDISIIGSFQRSYELVSHNWWITFGYGLIFFIIVSILSAIFSIPTYLISIGVAFDIKFFTSDVYFYVATFISQMGSFLLYPILYVAMGVLYYSHRTRMEGIDMESDIDNIGSFSDNQKD